MVLIRIFVFTAVVVVCLAGCVHVIPKEILSDVDREVSFAELRKSPKAQKGKVVLLGGVVVKTLNKKDGTLLEIYQTEIDREGRPVRLDVSGGRFLAYYKGFLDSEIYHNGRKVTVVGIVEGKKVMRLGEVDYHYLYLVIKVIHLWKDKQPYVYEPYPWGLWRHWHGDPWHPRYWPYWRYRHKKP